MRRVMAFVICSAGFLLTPCAADEMGFVLDSAGKNFSTILVPGSTFDNRPFTEVFGINDSGQLIGETNTFSFLYSDGVFTPVLAPNGSPSAVRGINNSGQIVGSYADSSTESNGFVNSNGSSTTIDFPGAIETELYGINDLGQIVGTSFAVHETQSFLYSDGVFTVISDPGATVTYAYGVNDNDEIVGVCYLNNRWQGFLDRNGVFTPINLPGSGQTTVTGISNTGLIVGYSDMGSFLDSDGVFTNVRIPNSVGTLVYGVNDNGQIAGVYLTPEPSATLLTALGLFAVVVFARYDFKPSLSLNRTIWRKRCVFLLQKYRQGLNQSGGLN